MKRFFLLFLCLLITCLAISCGEKDGSAVSSDTEIVKVPNDKKVFDNLQQVEKNSTIIVEAVPEESIEQYIDDSKDNKKQRKTSDYGYTKWRINVTKIYKGDVKVGDKLIILLEYYISNIGEDNEKLITFTALMPPVSGKEYILFLAYDKKNNAYNPVCDYEGMYPEPDSTLKEKVHVGSLKQSDLEVYPDEPLKNLVAFYTKVVHKYFQ